MRRRWELVDVSPDGWTLHVSYHWTRASARAWAAALNGLGDPRMAGFRLVARRRPVG